MSEQNRAIGRRIVEDYWNQRNPALAGELFAANCSLYTPDGDVQGVEGMEQIYNTYETACTDFRVTIEDPIAEGDRVAVRYTFTGTHNGPLGAIPASGNSLTESAIVIFRLAGGKVAEGRGAWDRVSVQQQIGAFPRTSGQAAPQKLFKRITSRKMESARRNRRC